jgi:alpha-glucosidase (family GH31 glycosyl hydrolase)
MLGKDLIMAPVLKKNSSNVKITIPGGEEWVNIWNGKSAD